MIIAQPISKENFILHCMHHYDNPQCTSVAEFEDDLKKFVYIKKLLKRHLNGEELKDRLILNHIIVLHNLFGLITPDLLFFKMEQELWPALATFMKYLQLMPERIPEFGIVASELPDDPVIVAALEKI